MLVLAIECSSPEGSVAILEGGRILANQVWSHTNSPAPGAHQHSELLIPSIRMCLQFSKSKIADINLIAVGNGPGRFTGVRVAVNAARTIAFSLNKPISCFSSLEVLAAAVPAEPTNVLALFNAHKNSVYLQEFQKLGDRYRPKSSPAVAMVDSLEEKIQQPVICVGDGYTAYEAQFSPALKKKLIRKKTLGDFPSAGVLGLIATQDFDPVTTLDWESVAPLYIRASEAEEKLKAGSLQEVRAPNWKE